MFWCLLFGSSGRCSGRTHSHRLGRGSYKRLGRQLITPLTQETLTLWCTHKKNLKKHSEQQQRKKQCNQQKICARYMLCPMVEAAHCTISMSTAHLYLHVLCNGWFWEQHLGQAWASSRLHLESPHRHAAIRPAGLLWLHRHGLSFTVKPWAPAVYERSCQAHLCSFSRLS